MTLEVHELSLAAAVHEKQNDETQLSHGGFWLRVVAFGALSDYYLPYLSGFHINIY